MERKYVAEGITEVRITPITTALSLQGTHSQEGESGVQLMHTDGYRFHFDRNETPVFRLGLGTCEKLATMEYFL